MSYIFKLSANGDTYFLDEPAEEPVIEIPDIIDSFVQLPSTDYFDLQTETSFDFITMGFVFVFAFGIVFWFITYVIGKLLGFFQDLAK